MEIDSIENSNSKKTRPKKKSKKKVKPQSEVKPKSKPKSKSIIKKNELFDIEKEISKTEKKLPKGLSEENMNELKMFIRSEVRGLEKEIIYVG